MSRPDVLDRARRSAEADATGDREPAPAVAVEHLTKRFGSGPDAVTAVDDLSLSIPRGSVVGLLGPNGAGKTTTIKCMLGMVLPDAGTVRIHGIDVTERPRAAYAHVDAMLEGARNDYWRLTVRENLRYFATINGVDPDSIAARHERLLERLDLADRADDPVRDLSRGMKQKVSLASVLAGGADVVFLDEPTLGLDVESARTLRAELRRIVAERDLTVVLSSHDMATIEAVCDRVVVVNEGRVVADDTVANLRAAAGTRGIRLASADLTTETVAALRERFPVTGVDRRADATEIEVAVDGDAIYDFLATCRDRGVRIEAIHSVEPDLADVLVELTGGVEP
jgi:ABC-2 type transport system ATP-binding protein